MSGTTTITGNEVLFRSNKNNEDIVLNPENGKNLVIKRVKKNIGSYYLDAPATTAIVIQDVWVKIEGTTFLNPDSVGFTNGNNRLTYTAEDNPITFTFVYTISLSGTTNKSGQIGVSRNGGTPPTATRVINTVDSGGRVVSSSKSGLVRLYKGDYIELWIRNLSSNADFVVENLSFTLSA
jgi:hypothetical protein